MKKRNFGTMHIGRLLLPVLLITLFLFLILNLYLLARKESVIKFISQKAKSDFSYSSLRVTSFDTIRARGVLLSNKSISLHIAEMNFRVSPVTFFKTKNIKSLLSSIHLQDPVLEIKKNQAVTNKISIPSIDTKIFENLSVLISADNLSVTYDGKTNLFKRVSGGTGFTTTQDFDLYLSATINQYTLTVNSLITRTNGNFKGSLSLLNEKDQIGKFLFEGHGNKTNFLVSLSSEQLKMESQFFLSPNYYSINYKHNNLTIDQIYAFLPSQTLQYFATVSQLFEYKILSKNTITSGTFSYSNFLTNEMLQGSLALTAATRVANAKIYFTKANTNDLIVRGNYRSKTKGGIDFKSSHNLGFPLPSISIKLNSFKLGNASISKIITLSNESKSNATILVQDFSKNVTFQKFSIAASDSFLTLTTPPNQFPLNANLLYDNQKKKMVKFDLNFKELNTATILRTFLNNEILNATMSGDFLYDAKSSKKFFADFNIYDSLTKEETGVIKIITDEDSIILQKFNILINDQWETISGKVDLPKSSNQLITFQFKNKQNRLDGNILSQSNAIKLHCESNRMFDFLEINLDLIHQKLVLDLSNFMVGGQSPLNLNLDLFFTGMLEGSGKFEFPKLSMPGFVGDARGLLTVKNKTLYAEKVYLKDNDLVLKGGGYLFPGISSSFYLEFIQVDKPGKISFNGVIKGKNILAEASIAQLNLSDTPLAAASKLAKGTVRIHSVISGKLGSPNLNSKIYLQNYPFNGRHFNIYSDFLKFNENLEFRNLVVFPTIGQEVKLISAEKITLTGGVIETKGVKLLDFPLLWKVSGDVTCKYDLRNGSGLLSINNFTLDGATAPNFITHINKNGKTLQLQAPSGSGFAGHFSPQSFEVACLFKNRTNAISFGDFRKNETEIVIHSDVIRLGHLNMFGDIIVKEKHKFSYFDYTYNGKTYKNKNLFLAFRFTKDGKRTLNGKMESRGSVQLGGMKAMADNYLFSVSIENNILSSHEIKMSWPDGEATANGELDFGNLSGVENFDLEIVSKGKRGIPMRLNIDKFEIDGEFTKGKVALTGNLNYPEISGKVELFDTEITYLATRRSEAFRSATLKRDNFFERVKWELEINVDKKVSFSSPILDCRLKSTSEVLFSGTVWNDSYSINGHVESDSGTYTHAGTDFRINSLGLKFPSGEKSINPIVSLVGEFKVRDEELDQNISIFIHKNSRLLEESLFTFTSVPVKSQDEIKSYLGYGAGAEEKDSEKAIRVSTKLVTDNVLRPIEQQIRKAFKLDYFNLDANVSGSENIIEGTGNLNNNLLSGANAKIKLGKYFGENLFLQTGVDYNYLFQTNRNNIGNVGGGVGFEYDLKILNLEGELKMKDFNSPLNLDAKMGVKKNWRF